MKAEERVRNELNERVKKTVEDALRQLEVMVELNMNVGMDIHYTRLTSQSLFGIIESYIKESAPFITKDEAKDLYHQVAEMRIMLLEKYNIY